MNMKMLSGWANMKKKKIIHVDANEVPGENHIG